MARPLGVSPPNCSCCAYQYICTYLDRSRSWTRSSEQRPRRTGPDVMWKDGQQQKGFQSRIFVLGPPNIHLRHDFPPCLKAHGVALRRKHPYPPGPLFNEPPSSSSFSTPAAAAPGHRRSGMPVARSLARARARGPSICLGPAGPGAARWRDTGPRYFGGRARTGLASNLSRIRKRGGGSDGNMQYGIQDEAAVKSHGGHATGLPFFQEFPSFLFPPFRLRQKQRGRGEKEGKIKALTSVLRVAVSRRLRPIEREEQEAKKRRRQSNPQKNEQGGTDIRPSDQLWRSHLLRVPSITTRSYQRYH